jgi:predicted ATPase
VARSLVTVDVGGAVARYRLLDMTRAYAREKLAGSGEDAAVARHHAGYFRDLFERAEAEWETRPTVAWLADYGTHLDDIRTALDWAFSANGEASTGIALTAAAIPLWTHLSLLDESRRWAERALAAAAQQADPDCRRAMRLHCALAASLLWARGAASEVLAAWGTTLEIAIGLADAEYRLRALWGLWLCHQILGTHRTALDFAEQFHALAKTCGEPADRLIGERLIGGALHSLGDQAKARGHIERMLAGYVSPPTRSHIDRFQRDQRAGAHSVLARILWVQGFPDQASRAAEIAVDEVRRSGHTASLCVTLAESACPIAFENGDLIAAVQLVEMLLDYAAKHALSYWLAWGRSFEGALALKRGDPIGAVRLLRAGITELGAGLITMPFVSFHALLAKAMGRAGLVAEGLATIDAVLGQPERTDERSNIAELLRIKGELLLLQLAPDGVTAAEAHFHDAIERANRQGALSWELRASLSLAKLWRELGRG